MSTTEPKTRKPTKIINISATSEGVSYELTATSDAKLTAAKILLRQLRGVLPMGMAKLCEEAADTITHLEVCLTTGKSPDAA